MGSGQVDTEQLQHALPRAVGHVVYAAAAVFDPSQQAQSSNIADK